MCFNIHGYCAARRSASAVDQNQQCAAEGIRTSSKPDRVVVQVSEKSQPAELTNAVPQLGSYVALASTQPVQSFGFIADESQSTLRPFAALVAQL